MIRIRDQIIEGGMAGQRPFGVAAHSVRDHQDTNVVRQRTNEWLHHIPGQNEVMDGNTILVNRANSAAMGQGSDVPTMHAKDLSVWRAGFRCASRPSGGLQ